MNNGMLQAVNMKQTFEQEKKQIMHNIKMLQRELIKASFKQATDKGLYADLLHSINEERSKIKQLNSKLTQA